VRTAPCPSGSASETNNECQIKFELLHVSASARGNSMTYAKGPLAHNVHPGVSPIMGC